MSCEHGEWSDCERCAEVDRAYGFGYKAGKSDAVKDAAAPVSGRGASIADDAEFMDLMNRYAKQIYSNLSTFAMDEARDALIAYIDSHPRSEDSRAKVSGDQDEN